MSTYALISVWRMDPARAEAQQRGLEERIIPMSRLFPGFLQGRWTRATDGERHIAFLEFETAENADAFADMVRSAESSDHREAAGVTNESMDIVEVIGAA